VIPIRNQTLRFVLVAAVQVIGIWLVVKLWQAIGPYVGLPGLFVWLFGCYWLASRMDRGHDERFFEELKRRGWKPPPNA
jgi:hypothetical protein